MPVTAPPAADAAAYERAWGLPEGSLAGQKRKRAAAPLVVGVAGPSGAGKSTLARRLAEALGGVVVREDPKFFLKSCAPSYALRDPISEEPAHVDWPGTAAALDAALEAAAAAEAPRPVVVEHYLLLAPEGGAVHLAPKCDLVLMLDAPQETCRERRVGRSDRPPAEMERLREYYDGWVFPAFVRNTREPFEAFAGAKWRLDATMAADEVLGAALGACADRLRRRGGS